MLIENISLVLNFYFKLNCTPFCTSDVSIDETIKQARGSGKRLIEKYEEKLRKYQVE